MALPPVETTPVMLMRFTPKANHAVIASVIEALTQGGIIVVESEGLYDENGKTIVATAAPPAPADGVNDERSPVVLGLSATQEVLERQAEEVLRLEKPCRTSLEHAPIVMEHFSVLARGDFVNVTREKNEEDYDREGLFTSVERVKLVESLISAILCPESLQGAGGGRVPKTKVLPRRQRGFQEPHVPRLREVLERSEYVDVLAPVHIPHIRDRIAGQTYSLLSGPPIQAICDYYGVGVAFYFAWMHHMTCWYALPGMLGLAVYVLRGYRGDTVDNCDLTPFVGLITFCWAVLCAKFWQRREAKLAYHWGTFVAAEADKRSLDMRPGFRGIMRKSPITGIEERYYPASRRRFKYVISALITLFILAGVWIVMVIGMNMQGYISREDEELWSNGEHPLYYPFFAQLAAEGAIFDAKSAWKSFLPVILRALVVVNLNQQYSKLAERLAEWENHETVEGHQNSVIWKRVLFEAFDAYIILFYLTVFERDVVLLRLELVGAFNIDTLRRLFTECVIPYVVKKSAKDTRGKSKKDDDRKKQTKTDIGRLTAQADLEEYDSFDDFIEMVIQFGYVTLFASAYPLAAFIAIGANMIEMRADMWKLAHLFRRVTPVRSSDIGSWEWALGSIAWLAAASNLVIFAFTSSQLRQWLPSYYVTDEVSGKSVPAASSAGEVLLVVLIIEHCVLILAMLVKTFIASTPESVRVEVQQRQWFHEKLASDARSLKVTSREVNSPSQASSKATLATS